MVARAYSYPLERTRPESRSLEFARANASEFQSEILQLSLFFSLFSIPLPQQPAINLDLLSTSHSSFNTHINDTPNHSINPQTIHSKIHGNIHKPKFMKIPLNATMTNTIHK
eukprot:TRINITY_DN4280_c1_g1_i1.p1 TRINITY_DN4280_c1_g1~~TRINITY_DN4280_c1_g1_i1.p1  ORF type:complete len:121 (+),score=8.03 TRINITY_DN4280_c1_g1_i1:29-364(+)